jgi:hypothetical protein
VSYKRRTQLQKALKLTFFIALLFIAFVLIDFSFNQARPAQYRFTLPELVPNKPVLLQQGNMQILVAHFDHDFKIPAATGRQMPTDVSSRLDKYGYFVSLGYGTDMGCAVRIESDYIRESCSQAVYDLYGRSLNQDLYKDLEIPHYRWNKNFTALTIYQE